MSPRQIEAIGITNQRETTLVWDRYTGAPVANAVVWQCRRSAPICDALERQGMGPLVRQKTGLPIDPYFSATKIRWILDNIPCGQARAERGDLLFGTVDTWLLWNLTGRAVHATDVTNASRTMLYDIAKLAWDDDPARCTRHPAGDAAGRPAVERHIRPHACGPASRAGDTDRRRRRRPARCPLRPGLLPARHGQEHLRHGLLRARQHGIDPRPLAVRPHNHRRLGHRRRGDVRPGGERLLRRGYSPVAARRPRASSSRPRR